MSKKKVKTLNRAESMPKRRFVAYARVSGRAQEDNTSTETQIEAIKRFCEHSGHQLIHNGIYQEVCSGSDKKTRKELQKALYRMKQEDCEGLIVFDIDRFSRNIESGLRIWREHFQEGAKTLISVRQCIDTSGNEGWYMFSQLLLFAEYECRKIRSRFDNGKRFMLQRQEGAYLGGPEPFGWNKKPLPLVRGSRQKFKLVENPAEQAWIAKMMNWRNIDGWTGTQIADQLNHYRVKTKRGKQWTRQQVDRMLSRMENPGALELSFLNGLPDKQEKEAS
ncbi:MAG TPA: recombinase family protein [Oculatellaceae cyanobacterium]